MLGTIFLDVVIFIGGIQLLCLGIMGRLWCT